jgi:hypothetical protein
MLTPLTFQFVVLKSKNLIYRLLMFVAILGMVAVETKSQDTLSVNAPVIASPFVRAIEMENDKNFEEVDSALLAVMPDSVLDQKFDSVAMAIAEVDSIMSNIHIEEPAVWVPDPKKAMWLAIVFPGGGQIYNRKYWKLPIVYGGLLGCVYALNWNNTMYQDYSQAYVDIMDDDPNTKSYENFIPPSYNINQNMTRMQDLFKRKKNYYRRYRDLSIFCMIGVYALSILDAYVDAELSSFDISKDLSMKVKPAIINDKNSMVRGNVLKSSSYGLQCSFNF